MELDSIGFSLAAKLAWATLRPLESVGDRQPSPGGLPLADLRAIASHPAFRGPVNRAVARTLRLHEMAIGPASLSRLAGSVRTRLAVLIAADRLDHVEAAAGLTAAAILARRVTRLTLKRDVERARAILGDAGFQLATLEAAVLHANLADLELSLGPAVLDEPDLETACRKATTCGLLGLTAFVEAVEPDLSRLVAHRFPVEGAVPGTGGDLRLSPAQCDQLTKLLRRRMPQWAAIFG